MDDPLHIILQQKHTKFKGPQGVSNIECMSSSNKKDLNWIRHLIGLRIVPSLKYNELKQSKHLVWTRLRNSIEFHEEFICNVSYTAGWDRNHPQTNTEKNIPTTFRADINVLGSYEFRKSVSVCYRSYLGTGGQILQGSRWLRTQK